VLRGQALETINHPACAAINTLSQAGAFLFPFLWGRAADLTGSFHLGLIGLAAATAAALLLTMELANHVRKEAVPA
jgi:MFS-type transporter involved in bile tolerance (Atg22 family)